MYLYSLIMLLNKIQSSAELSLIKDLPAENLDELLKETPEQLVDILVSVIRTLCKRINATEEETENCVAIVRTGNMGYLFENMEPMDIQAERRKTAQAVERLQQVEESYKEELKEKDARIQELEQLLKEYKKEK